MVQFVDGTIPTRYLSFLPPSCTPLLDYLAPSATAITTAALSTSTCVRIVITLDRINLRHPQLDTIDALSSMTQSFSLFDPSSNFTPNDTYTYIIRAFANHETAFGPILASAVISFDVCLYDGDVDIHASSITSPIRHLAISEVREHVHYSYL